MTGYEDLVLPAHDWSAALAAAAAEGDDRPTWAYAWPAGERIRGELTALVELAGRRVCDLGCGQGRLGLTALLAGAAVCFADGSSHPLRWLRAVLAANDLDADCVEHQWGDLLPGGPYDLVLGGDILYRPECFADLLATIAASLVPDGCALLADPRSRLEPELPELAATAGLRWASERRDAGYTLVRLTPG